MLSNNDLPSESVDYMKKQELCIPVIRLEWSDWTEWDKIKNDAMGKNGVPIPNGKPGVYEARLNDQEERLHIGKASNLRMRVRQGLVKGKIRHSTGDKIRKFENTSAILVRWAETDRPAAAEEELHRLHKERFSGRLPKYTKH